jgi:hypothetical protein
MTKKHIQDKTKNITTKTRGSGGYFILALGGQAPSKQSSISFRSTFGGMRGWGGKKTENNYNCKIQANLSEKLGGP